MANTRDIIGDQATLDGLVGNTLTELEESDVTMLYPYCLYGHTSLQVVRFPNVRVVDTQSFTNCSNLHTIDIGLVQSISGSLGAGTSLQHLLLRNPWVLGGNSTSNYIGACPLGNLLGMIYVPGNLVDSYKAQDYWGMFNIASLEDYPLSRFDTIVDDWATIVSNPNYATDYHIGDTKMLDLGSIGKTMMEIAAFNEDNRADNTGKAGITWISKPVLNTLHNMNNTNTTEGGWATSAMRSYLKNTIKPLIPATVRNAIVEVTKISCTYENGAIVPDGQITTDDVWIPSNHEIFSTITTYETTGATYSSKFVDSISREKCRDGSASGWWLRSAGSATNFRRVNSNGSTNSGSASSSYGVALGFCTN